MRASKKASKRHERAHVAFEKVTARTYARLDQFEEYLIDPAILGKWFTNAENTAKLRRNVIKGEVNFRPDFTVLNTWHFRDGSTHVFEASYHTTGGMLWTIHPLLPPARTRYKIIADDMLVLFDGRHSTFVRASQRSKRKRPIVRVNPGRRSKASR